jgi:hypothetical protein
MIALPGWIEIAYHARVGEDQIRATMGTNAQLIHGLTAGRREWFPARLEDRWKGD